LEISGWNRKVAANDLQISYKALLYKIKQYNLSPPPRKRQVSIEKAPNLDRAQSA
jgi:DNA-binding NtrC family response regulator